MTPAERIVCRLRTSGILEPLGITLPDGVTARRTYAGYWQRQKGAWVWCLYSPDGFRSVQDDFNGWVGVGSISSMGVLLAAEGWTATREMSDVQIDAA